MTMHPAKSRLLARTGRGAHYGLERMARALEALDHPERGLSIVHVAGTNGKGSVCAMLDAIARASGLSTGMFTSPHLCRLNERIRLDGEPLDDERFGAVVDRVLSADASITFFEAMTLAGFVAMQEARVDVAIVEVGLGGRLDATNVIGPPTCAVITSIGRDHIKILGDDLADIAREKAGIIKAGAPLALGPLEEPARSAILTVAEQRGSGPITAVAASPEQARWLRARDLAVVEIATRDRGIELTGAVEAVIPTLALRGPHQHRNAATAAAAMTQLAAVSRPSIEAGLAAARWPGRLERIDRGALTFILDCAHNEHGARALVEALTPLDPARTQLVFGAMDDKLWPEMLALLAPLVGRRHYCVPLTELAGRAPADPHALAARLPGAIHPSVPAAILAAEAGASPGDEILVTGSIFLVGAARAYLTGEPCDVAVPL